METRAAAYKFPKILAQPIWDKRLGRRMLAAAFLQTFRLNFFLLKSTKEHWDEMSCRQLFRRTLLGRVHSGVPKSLTPNAANMYRKYSSEATKTPLLEQMKERGLVSSVAGYVPISDSRILF